MTTSLLLRTLTDAGIRVHADADDLELHGNTNRLTPALRELVCQRKAELLTILREREEYDRRGVVYWHYGSFRGPNIEKHEYTACACCSWNAPVQSDGICCMCARANDRLSGEQYCECWCDRNATLLSAVRRIDPGGPLMCNQCADQQRARRALRQKVAVNA